MRGGGIFFVLAAAVAGCGLVAGLNGDYSDPTDAGAPGAADADAPDGAREDGNGAGSFDGTAGDGGADSNADAITAACNAGTMGGPSMMQAASLDGGTFCIDTTEVTQAEYQVFLSRGLVPSQGDPCQWNKSYAPGGDPPSGCKDYPLSASDHPVACVDWCDALGFCAWAGKRLCGEIGGGALDYDTDPLDVTKSEWFAACTRNDPTSNVYPYGTSFVPGQCVEMTTSPAAVGSFTACQGGYPGLFDMSGNVSEWEDACDTNGAVDSQSCHARGGDYASTGLNDPSLRCSGVTSVAPRKSVAPARGFRCCKG